MMQISYRWFVAFAALAVPSAAAHATKPKIDADTCAQLRLEEAKAQQSGIVNEMSKGPEWAKANLAQDKLDEIKHYITLDEQVKFGCRDAKVSADAEKASAAASRIEINSDADPTAPITPAKTGKALQAADPPKPQAAPAKKTSKKRTTRRTAKATPATQIPAK